MDIFLLFSKTRSLFVILIESFKDSKAFLIIVAYICYFFALITSLIEIGDEDKLSLVELIFMVFQDALGGFSAPDKETFSNTGERMANWLKFLLL
jgi:hypothetical protein